MVKKTEDADRPASERAAPKRHYAAWPLRNRRPFGIFWLGRGLRGKIGAPFKGFRQALRSNAHVSTRTRKDARP
jgi:hypothetical protein